MLNVGDDRALKLALKIAAQDTSITVTAPAASVNVSPAVGTVIDRQFAEHLPLNGRSFQALITMTPGVVLTTASSTTPGQFSVNGQRSDANYFTVADDGIGLDRSRLAAAGGLG